MIGPYLASKAAFKTDVLKPLQLKPEPVYVMPGTDAEDHVTQRFPHKTPRRVGSGLLPRTIDALLLGMPLTFQRDKAAGLTATYHFTFTGKARRETTIRIENRALAIEPGLVGKPDLTVRVDGAAWLAFVRKERSIVRLFLSGKLRLSGSPRLLIAFGKCFP